MRSLDSAIASKRAAVAGRECPFFEQILDRLFQSQQAHGVGDRRAILAGALGDLLLREMEFVCQALECARLFDGI